jgi:hypothetical protein
MATTANNNKEPRFLASEKTAEAQQLRIKINEMLNGQCARISYFNTEPGQKSTEGDPKWMIYLTYVFLPFALGPLSTMGFYFANPCIQFVGDLETSTALFWSVWITYALLSFSYLGRDLYYIATVEFCTPTHLNNHRAMQWPLFCFLGASLNWYQVYNYSLNLWYIFASVFCLLATFITYIGCFWEQGVRRCPAPNHIRASGPLYDPRIRILDFLAWAGIFVLALVACWYDFQNRVDPWRTWKVGNGTCLTGN